MNRIPMSARYKARLRALFDRSGIHVRHLRLMPFREGWTVCFQTDDPSYAVGQVCRLLNLFPWSVRHRFYTRWWEDQEPEPEDHAELNQRYLARLRDESFKEGYARTPEK